MPAEEVKGEPGELIDRVITLLAPGLFPSVLGFPFLTDALLAFPDLTGPGTLRLSGPLIRKEASLGPGQVIGSGRRARARRGTPWRGRRGVRLGMARAA